MKYSVLTYQCETALSCVTLDLQSILTPGKISILCATENTSQQFGKLKFYQAVECSELAKSLNWNENSEYSLGRNDFRLFLCGWAPGLIGRCDTCIAKLNTSRKTNGPIELCSESLILSPSPSSVTSDYYPLSSIYLVHTVYIVHTLNDTWHNTK